MNFKFKLKLFIVYFIVSIFVTFWVVTVFSTDLVFEPQITEKSLLSENIFLDNKDLRKNFIYFESNIDLSEYKLSSRCSIESNFIWYFDNKYFFRFEFLNKCSNWFIFLKSPENIILQRSLMQLNFFSHNLLFDLYVDNNNKTLKKVWQKLNNNIKQLKEILHKNTKKDFNYFKNIRNLQEFKYHKNFLEIILKNRNKKYLVPVEWFEIPTKKNKIPNAWRPHRAAFTDWIHRGWDIVTPLGTPVISLDYGKIVRIVTRWQFSDFDKIKLGNNLSYRQQNLNLDILRWNQVWLKTSRWDVVFYSHLKNIPETLEMWDIVERWVFLWEIWVSGISDKNYTNFHLHFPIMKNPHIKSKVWTYTFMDYMKWDWYFKGKPLEYVSKNSGRIFKSFTKE